MDKAKIAVAALVAAAGYYYYKTTTSIFNSSGSNIGNDNYSNEGYNYSQDNGGFIQTAWDSLSGVTDNIYGAIGDGLGYLMGSVKKYWSAPDKYRPTIQATEVKYGLPTGMLERLLYQESHYREDIITGRTKSAVGALGIAQFMPDTAASFGINPLDWKASVDKAGLYLKQLYGMFRDWKIALAAYNWGPGNVKKYGIAKAPTETRLYYSQISADVGIA